MKTLAERVHYAVNVRFGGNWAELGRQAGLSVSTIQNVKGGADPRASTLAKLATALGVSLAWLVAGDGDSPVGSDEGDVPDDWSEVTGEHLDLWMAPRGRERYPRAWAKFGAQLEENMSGVRKSHETRHALMQTPEFQRGVRETPNAPMRVGLTVMPERMAAQTLLDLGLSGPSMLSARGAHAGLFRVMVRLQEVSPGSCTLEELLPIDETDPKPTMADLSQLMRAGLVEVSEAEGSQRFKAAQSFSSFKSRSDNDLSQLALEIVRSIGTTILPACEGIDDGAGRLFLAVGGVPREQSRAFMEDLCEYVRKRLQALAPTQQTDDVITVALGVSVEAAKRVDAKPV